MKTEVISPRELFKQPQQLAVPLFQRSYAWKQAEQWAPLWHDVTRVAEQVLADRLSARPHFLGALVHQQVGNPPGHLQEWTVIDGQQRLTTLQLLMDAIHRQLVRVNVPDAAKRVRNLIENEAEYREREHDRFKVWPTNRDRAAFRSVMEAPGLIDYGTLEHRASRIVHAHQFFTKEAERWLDDQANGFGLVKRANALERTISELIEMVVIRLAPEEDAQEIFETLNARGAQLTPADLIKNFVFQELMTAGDDVESIYDEHWKHFETPFWEAEISLGRYHHIRSSAFLYHWLVAHTPTKEPMLAGEVFERFKDHALRSNLKMGDLVVRIHRASRVYEDITWIAPGKADPITAVDLFAYRVSVLQSEVVKPVLLLLLDPEQDQVPPDQLQKAFRAIESWLIRRTLVRAGTKSHTKVFVDLMNAVRGVDRSAIGDMVGAWLEKQTSEEARWPDNREVRDALRKLPVYRVLSRGRLRMVLEAIEDDLRGFNTKRLALAEGRAPRGTLSIEHVLPQRWQSKAWPLRRGVTEDDRRALIHTLGNLTLVTKPLNSALSRAQWTGAAGKREALKAHSVLRLNRDIIEGWPRSWSEEAISDRTEELINCVLRIWPAPAGHNVQVEHKKPLNMHDVTFADFLELGILADGDVLYPIPKKWTGRYGTVLANGQIRVDGSKYDSPRDAEKAITGKPHASGWRFFALDANGTVSLRKAWLDAQEEESEEGELMGEPEDLEEVAEI